MPHLTLPDFADKLDEMMSLIMKEFLKHQSGDFYKTKITLPQFHLLVVLKRMGEAKMTELAHFMNVTTAAMTGIIDRLVRDGYAERESDPKDRRIVRIRLTKNGQTVMETMLGQRRQMIMKMFGMITEKERDAYLKILGHIRSHLNGHH